jgi:GNAT superfamily N-acetyltransferase
MPSERLGAWPWWREIGQAPMALRVSGPARLLRLLQVKAALDAHHPMRRPHDYLWFLGVRPEAQGAGVGSGLMAAAAARLDRARRPAFLETAQPRNLAFYRRHGFAEVDRYRPAPGAPEVWSMWRDPS